LWRFAPIEKSEPPYWGNHRIACLNKKKQNSKVSKTKITSNTLRMATAQEKIALYPNCLP